MPTKSLTIDGEAVVLGPHGITFRRAARRSSAKPHWRACLTNALENQGLA
jgi:hypothetical protein